MKVCLRILTIVMSLSLGLAAVSLAGDRVPDERSTATIERDLRNTEYELAKLQRLQKDLDRASRQSSNVARSSAVSALDEFMLAAVKRRERDLGQKMTLKQQGEMVRSGTTEVAEVGSPVPTNRRNGGRVLYDTSDGDRLHILLNLQTLQVSAKNISRPASEGQEKVFDQYVATVSSFAQQISAAKAALEAELASREAPADSTGTDD